MAISMEGPLSKWTNVVKGWQYRWFVLDETVGLLSYYTSKEKMMRGARRGCLRLKGALLGIDDEDDSTFTISCDQKTFHFQARDAEEREKWIGGLENTIMKHSHSGLRRPFGTDLGLIAAEDDLDKRVLEAEAYFKLFTEQVKTLHAQIDKDCENKQLPERYQIVKETSTKMLENIGQSLEMIHSVKEACEGCPSSLIGDHEQSNKEVVENLPKKSSITEAVSPGINVHEPFLIPNNGSPSAVRVKAIPGTSPTGSQAQRMADAFPTISYSSSEDEDEAEFFDANEYDNDTASSESHRAHGDAYHEDEDDIFGAEIEGDDIKKHGSIITHLLSQVRLGMDLTKVVLPTFILERRSLLEMYADFLAHPDLFVSIVDYSDPKERMTQVVRWYLSAFHAGRKSSIAKKPYNPILGETFTCHYVLDESNRSKELTKDGPVIGVSKDDVSFIAEQVSHHPPISAFYGEHQNKNIYLNGHIWTKSKFLGLSIGVEMCGQAVISVVPYDEEYTVTFPNGYGRSILTVPWMELGGQATITCAQTGYNAAIHFHCKPFYGGKKHRITADIMSPGEKKPFLTVNGEWNGVMYYKDGKEAPSSNNLTATPDVFIDTKSMPVIKKRVTPLEKQGEFESRRWAYNTGRDYKRDSTDVERLEMNLRLWRDVTTALKNNDVESATAAKHKLEERQRAEARERKEKGEEWQTKFFHNVNGLWTYGELLKNRINSNNVKE